MAGSIIGAPNSPPTADADWDKVVNNYVVGGKGQNSISLTNWVSANTTLPAIAAGSSIEINGAFATFGTETAITGGSSGTIYLYIDVTTTPGTPLPKFTNSAPTWDDAKGGWYSSNDRYTGHFMTWNGASAYTEKGVFDAAEKTGLTIKKHIDGSIITLDGVIDGTEISGTVITGTSLDINGNADISGNLTGVDALTASGKITGAELEGTSLDINGSGDISGNLIVTGDITTDSVMTDNIKLKTKKFTGTLDSSGNKTIAHGLDWSKILGVSFAIQRDNGYYYSHMAIYTVSGTYWQTVYFDSTNCVLNFNFSNDWTSRPYRLIIFYEDN
ncbi:hypothetical protein DRQ25_09110 [Candidatus Fermentibacteria bacterium]|nr:MAG: hypothetical protein DRQ25_09110 [Candidatus Fermentibacteria bacterium]